MINSWVAESARSCSRLSRRRRPCCKRILGGGPSGPLPAAEQCAEKQPARELEPMAPSHVAVKLAGIGGRKGDAHYAQRVTVTDVAGGGARQQLPVCTSHCKQHLVPDLLCIMSRDAGLGVYI